MSTEGEARSLRAPLCGMARAGRAHELGITSLDYVEKRSFILSASADTRIKMWSVSTEGGETSTACATMVALGSRRGSH